MKKFLSLVKFSHTLFAMPFALIGYTWGVHDTGKFEWVLLFKVILCMIFARNAAMAYNRFADRKIDKLNGRTANREIPAGIISPRNAMIFVIVNSLLFILTTITINYTTAILSPIALLVILGYSVTKRFTYFCHVILGVALSIAPIGAYIAVTNSISLFPVLLSIAVVGWVSGFDIFYSTQDVDFDKDNNLYSMPCRLGIKTSLLISIFLRLISISVLALAGYLFVNNNIYWIGFSLFALFLAYQHFIVRKGDLTRINFAFATLNAAGSVIFAIFTIISIIYL